MNEEIIIDIIGYEGYYKISNQGYVLSLSTNRVLKPQIQNSGYYIVHLHVKTRKAFLLHRLVAIHFLDNPNNLPQVNHLDSNKLNCHYSNLEWCTQFDNMRHASLNGLLENQVKRGKSIMSNIGFTYGFENSQKFLQKAFPIEVVDKVTGCKQIFRSLGQMCIALNLNKSNFKYKIKTGKSLNTHEFQITILKNNLN